jgi:hypothetical protein
VYINELFVNINKLNVSNKFVETVAEYFIMSLLADVDQLDKINKLNVIFSKNNELNVKNQKTLTW